MGTWSLCTKENTLIIETDQMKKTGNGFLREVIFTPLILMGIKLLIQKDGY